MRAFPYLLLAILVFGLFLFGCASQPAANQNQVNTNQNQANQNEDQENPYEDLSINESEEFMYMYFYAPYLPDAVVGVPYNASFCDPTPKNTNDLCGALEDASNPSGGHHPYHFTLGSGVGFQQFGLLVNLNGLITGTPTAAGARTFEVCAVDLDGNQACDNVTFAVKEPLRLNVHVKGTGSGTVTVYGEGQPIVCRSDCVVNVSDSYASLDVAFMPDEGSAFGGWTGDCKYPPCQLFMTNESKDITAEFDKFALAASATCARTGDSGYNNRVEIRGTATGPKNSHIAIDDTQGYNGYLDMTDSCGSWGTGTIGCVNKGEASSTTWSSGFRMGSPTYENPFVWTPTFTLTVSYGGYGFYNKSIQEPSQTVITVPVRVSCP